MAPQQPIILYGFKLSGHSHRAEAMLRLLKLPYEFRLVDLAAGAQKAPSFRKLNPFGTVPVIDDDGVIVWDSVAILVYLATKYDQARTWLPADAAGAAAVQAWLSVAQGPVFNGPCAARLVKLFGYRLDHEHAKSVSSNLLDVLEAQLADRRFLVDRPTLADVAVYSYVARAPDGGVSLDPYPAVRSWLKRVEDLPGFEPMPLAPTGRAA